MADVFISYSSHDRDRALPLCEYLRSYGYTVWIDESSIDVATSWSNEIVHALDNCAAFIILLSQSSLVSKNVIKELSLAAEADKHIIPVELESVILPTTFKYHLAGLQRTNIENLEAITKALTKLGIEVQAILPESEAIMPEITRTDRGIRATEPAKPDIRKSLMILPFEDLSPVGDNAWFADGLVSELISSLSNFKDLRLVDRQTTMDFRRFKGRTADIARELTVRYFLEGSVSTSGQQVRIGIELLDFHTAEHLWQQTHKGSMEDIFELQDRVTRNVVENLIPHLSIGAKKKLTERGTNSSEAYQYYLKSVEFSEQG